MTKYIVIKATKKISMAVKTSFLNKANVMLLWPRGSLSPHCHPVTPWPAAPGREGVGAGSSTHGWGDTQLPSVQPPPNRQGCLTSSVFQPRPQANFNFLVIMQMNVDLIKGRFH